MTSRAYMPPGTELRGARLVRVIQHTNSRDGSTWEEIRPVAATLAEAKKMRIDYFSPRLGWIRNGIKTELDHPLPRPEPTEASLEDDEQEEYDGFAAAYLDPDEKEEI